jgi:CRISPR-associated protein Cmr4
MNGMILGLLAETFLHPGSGQNEGAIDLPVAREKPTDYPFVPGSGVKGAMRDRAFLLAKAEAAKNTSTLEVAVEAACAALDVRSFERAAVRWARERIDKLAEAERSKPGEIAKAAAEGAVEVVYGRPDGAGNLILSDAKLLLLPVRSLTSAYVWLTSPHLLERYVRDCERITRSRPNLDPKRLAADDTKVIVGAGGGQLLLEERSFAIEAKPAEIQQLCDAVSGLVPDADAKARLMGQLAVVSDRSFAWFARHGLPVAARNVLDENKVSKNLWYEESLPPDTVLFAMAFERRAGLLDHLKNGVFKSGTYLQLGGNETIGQGWFKVALG